MAATDVVSVVIGQTSRLQYDGLCGLIASLALSKTVPATKGHRLGRRSADNVGFWHEADSEELTADVCFHG
jgi:hypothetical protein